MLLAVGYDCLFACLLAIVACCWLLLLVVGYCYLLLLVVGYCCLLLVMIVACCCNNNNNTSQLSLFVAGYGCFFFVLVADVDSCCWFLLLRFDVGEWQLVIEVCIARCCH